MQVKKFEASTVIEALQEIKKELGPDAIILSTEESKKTIGGGKKFTVVAAVSEYQFKKKELAAQQLGAIFKDKVQNQSAQKQKMFIENVYRGAEKKYEKKNKTITQTQYIDIDNMQSLSVPKLAPQVTAEPVSSVARVKQAAAEAFKTSLTSDFFAKEVEPEDILLSDEALQRIVSNKKRETIIAGPVEKMIGRLKECGVSPEICDSLQLMASRELGSGIERRAIVDSWFAKWILNKIMVSGVENNCGVEIFVGPHGSGKTSALVKLATHYVIQEQKSIAIVTSDLNKVGGVEQLRVYSRILNAPVFVVSDPTQLGEKINQLEGFDKILVDTPGISLSNIEELDFMRTIAHLNPRVGQRVHLVISALTKESDLGGVLKRFRVANFDDVVVTNIDQTSQHGILINIEEKIAKPLHSFGIGSDIVDGFEVASRERVLDLVFKLTKQIGERGNDSRI